MDRVFAGQCSCTGLSLFIVCLEMVRLMSDSPSCVPAVLVWKKKRRQILTSIIVQIVRKPTESRPVSTHVQPVPHTRQGWGVCLDNRSLLFWSLQKAHLSTMCHKYWNSNQSVKKDVSGRKLGAGSWSFGCSLRHVCELRQGTRPDSCSPRPHDKRLSLLA